MRVVPEGEGKSKVARSSARSNQTRMRTLAMKDIKGFKRSDSIENFYDIQTTIGQGMLKLVPFLKFITLMITV